ncbi:MAG: FkbM family methyltransferase [Lachnospiraceae bacterium]|nr:FkbM family methyltransferase [Lachnospiraceae bacterium]
MKKAVIVYGLGYEYRKSEKMIHELFDVKGYSDINEDKSGDFNGFIPVEELTESDIEILIVSSRYTMEMIHELRLKGVLLSRMHVWLEELKKRQILSYLEKDALFAQAQFGEDYVIWSLLKEYGIDPTGLNYVELGVCNPYRCSNTYFLHVLGGKGVLVEADPRNIELIEVVRKNQIVLNKAIAERSGEKVKFYLSDKSSLSSMFPANITQINHGSIQEEIMIDTISINDVLGMLDDITVLSVDVEGYDIQALKDIDYKKYHPLIICAETGRPCDDLIDFMREGGYNLRFCNTSNTIWTYSL